MATKTVREWLETLPEPIRSLALVNAEHFRSGSRLTEQEDSLDNAIDFGFCWNDTPEGDDFWSQLSAHANRNDSIITQAWADEHMLTLPKPKKPLPEITVITVPKPTKPTKPKHLWPKL